MLDRKKPQSTTPITGASYFKDPSAEGPAIYYRFDTDTVSVRLTGRETKADALKIVRAVAEFTGEEEPTL